MDERVSQEPATQAARLQELTRGVQELEARVSNVGESVSELNERALNFINERPAAAIGIAFGVGFLIGKLASRRWLV